MHHTDARFASQEEERSEAAAARSQLISVQFSLRVCGSVATQIVSQLSRLSRCAHCRSCTYSVQSSTYPGLTCTFFPVRVWSKMRSFGESREEEEKTLILDWDCRFSEEGTRTAAVSAFEDLQKHQAEEGYCCMSTRISFRFESLGIIAVQDPSRFQDLRSGTSYVHMHYKCLE